MNLLKYPVLKTLLFVVMLIGITQFASAQSAQNGINNAVTKIEGYNNLLPAEKLYMQFDKPYYAAGDTIWFKAYLLTSTLNYSQYLSRPCFFITIKPHSVNTLICCDMAGRLTAKFSAIAFKFKG